MGRVGRARPRRGDIRGSLPPHARRPPLRSFAISSTLRAPPERVWRHATSPAGVNRELWPLLRMTFPAEADALAEDAAHDGGLEALAAQRPGERLFRAWVLLAGVLPVEYDDLAFAETGPGRRFLERSSLLTQRLWEHERTVDPHPRGTRITDRIRFASRIPWLEPVHAVVFGLVSRWRHRRLRGVFGGVGT